MKETARKLANDLFVGDPPCQEQKHDSPSCIRREGDRKDGQSIRSFSDYDPTRMCLACRAYWYAEMAAQSLERLDALERRKESRAS